jgi:hypothetical protein
MPRAPKGAAPAEPAPPTEDPWVTPDPTENTWPADEQGIAAAAAIEPDPPHPDTVKPDPEKLGAARVDPDPEPAKKAPAKRTRPKPVTGKPDASLPGGTAARATLEFGSLVEEEDFLNVLWYGPEGTGKTTAAALAAHGGKVLVINAEGGLKKRALAARGVPVDNLVIWPKPGHEEHLTRDNLEELALQVRQELRDDPTAWFAVLWDSGSAIAERLLRDIVIAEVAKNAAKPSHQQKDSRADKFFTDLSDYGTLTAQMQELVVLYRDLRCHFLITALERRDVDEDTGQVMYGPVFTPAVSSTVRADMDLVVRVRQTDNDGEQVIIGATRPNDRWRGKDRFGATPARMADPNFVRIRDYVEGRLTETDDPVQKTLPPVSTGGKKKESN